MVVLKALSLIVAGLLSVLALNVMMREMQAVRVKARSAPPPRPQVRRLRQDPRSGVYYPEG